MSVSCTTCEHYAKNGGFGPEHTPCRSHNREHCTADWCF